MLSAEGELTPPPSRGEIESKGSLWCTDAAMLRFAHHDLTRTHCHGGLMRTVACSMATSLDGYCRVRQRLRRSSLTLSRR